VPDTNRVKKMEKKVMFLLVVIAVVFTPIIDLQAQKKVAMRTLSGVVTDHLGEPLPGASITLKGTKTAVISNVDGQYSINVPENAILSFSFIGYVSQEIAIDNQQIMNVTMGDRFSQGLQPAEPIQLTAKQSKRAEADNSFAFKMFREVSNHNGDNAFFSPLSINIALGMLFNGASGDTHSEIVEALGIADFSETEINEYYQKISQALLEIDPTMDIAIANSIWYRNNFSVKNRFVEIGKEYFDAEVQALNFNSSRAANTINNWCAEKTNNKIKNLIGSAIPNDMMMYLVNALYFKNQWQMDLKFDKEKTKLDNFTKANNQKKKVNMMEQTSLMYYYADEKMQCVEMDYGNRAFSMVAILPSNNMNINQLIDYLDNEKLLNAVNNFRWQKVWLKLPRFKIECDFSLSEPLKYLGLGQMFNGGFANISDDDLWVSDIIQKTFVEVNEEGTEAAAATTVIMVGASGRPKKVEPVRFFADRPFLFLIREKSTGVILFIGRMDEPSE
jgi:serine protease inhibitor